MDLEPMSPVPPSPTPSDPWDQWPAAKPVVKLPSSENYERAPTPGPNAFAQKATKKQAEEHEQRMRGNAWYQEKAAKDCSVPAPLESSTYSPGQHKVLPIDPNITAKQQADWIEAGPKAPEFLKQYRVDKELKDLNLAYEDDDSKMTTRARIEARTEAKLHAVFNQPLPVNTASTSRTPTTSGTVQSRDSKQSSLSHSNSTKVPTPRKTDNGAKSPPQKGAPSPESSPKSPSRGIKLKRLQLPGNFGLSIKIPSFRSDIDVVSEPVTPTVYGLSCPPKAADLLGRDPVKKFSTAPARHQTVGDPLLSTPILDPGEVYSRNDESPMSATEDTSDTKGNDTFHSLGITLDGTRRLRSYTQHAQDRDRHVANVDKTLPPLPEGATPPKGNLNTNISDTAHGGSKEDGTKDVKLEQGQTADQPIEEGKLPHKAHKPCVASKESITIGFSPDSTEFSPISGKMNEEDDQIALKQVPQNRVVIETSTSRKPVVYPSPSIYSVAQFDAVAPMLPIPNRRESLPFRPPPPSRTQEYSPAVLPAAVFVPPNSYRLVTDNDEEPASTSKGMTSLTAQPNDSKAVGEPATPTYFTTLIDTNNFLLASKQALADVLTEKNSYPSPTSEDVTKIIVDPHSVPPSTAVNSPENEVRHAEVPPMIPNHAVGFSNFSPYPAHPSAFPTPLFGHGAVFGTPVIGTGNLTVRDNGQMPDSSNIITHFDVINHHLKTSVECLHERLDLTRIDLTDTLTNLVKEQKQDIETQLKEAQAQLVENIKASETATKQVLVEEIAIRRSETAITDAKLDGLQRLMEDKPTEPLTNEASDGGQVSNAQLFGLIESLTETINRFTSDMSTSLLDLSSRVGTLEKRFLPPLNSLNLSNDRRDSAYTAAQGSSEFRPVGYQAVPQYGVSNMQPPPQGLGPPGHGQPLYATSPPPGVSLYTPHHAHAQNGPNHHGQPQYTMNGYNGHTPGGHYQGLPQSNGMPLNYTQGYAINGRRVDINGGGVRKD